MSILAEATSGIVNVPAQLIVYGPEGVGKSTFAAEAPNPVFLASEDGTNRINTTRLKTPNWRRLHEFADALLKDKHDFKTVVLDSADAFESQLFKKICDDDGVKSIELAAGGYGKGYIAAMEEWEYLLSKMTRLRDQRGMHVIVIAHAHVIKQNNPALQMEYDRYEMRIHKRSMPKLKEWADAVLFLTYAAYLQKEGKDVRAYGDGTRVMYTQHRPGFDAKNRYGLEPELTFEKGQGWNTFASLVFNQPMDAPKPVVQEPAKPKETPEAVHSRIQALITKLKDPELAQKVFAKADELATNLEGLLALEEKLKARLK